MPAHSPARPPARPPSRASLTAPALPRPPLARALTCLPAGRPVPPALTPPKCCSPPPPRPACNPLQHAHACTCPNAANNRHVLEHVVRQVQLEGAVDFSAHMEAFSTSHDLVGRAGGGQRVPHRVQHHTPVDGGGGLALCTSLHVCV